MDKNKQLTFSQKLILLLLATSIIWVTWSYILATIGREPVESLAIAIVSTLILGLLAYFIKSFGEKNSRNKYKVDECGIPYDLKEGEENESSDI